MKRYIFGGWCCTLLLSAAAQAALTGNNIGGALPAGTIQLIPNGYRISGGGQDIWDVSDQFFFAHEPEPVAGDFTAIVAVRNFGPYGPGEPWAKAGLMARLSLATDSPHAMNIRSLKSGVAVQWRSTAGAQTGSNMLAYPEYEPDETLWLRLDRLDATFTACYAVGGETPPAVWDGCLPGVIAALAEPVYVGLATTSLRQGEAVSVDYLHFSVGPYQGLPLCRTPDLPDMPSGGAGWLGVREVADNGDVPDQLHCYRSLANGGGTIVDYETDLLNINDGSNGGHFVEDDVLGVVEMGHAEYGETDNLAMLVRGAIHVPEDQAGPWTLGVNSDDGFTLAFPGLDFSAVTGGELVRFTEGTAIRFYAARSPGDTLGVINLSPGDHNFWMTWHESGGGAGVELYAARGAYDGFDADLFRPIGYQGVGTMPVPGLAANASVIRSNPGRYGAITNLTQASQAIAAGIENGTNTGGSLPSVNLGDPDDGGWILHGYFPWDAAFPGDQVGVDENDFAVWIQGTIQIPRTGRYFLGFNSDDGASLRITGRTWEYIARDATGNAVLDGDRLINDSVTGSTFTVGAITLPAGQHAFQMYAFDRAGGAYVELFGRAEADLQWRLLTAGQARIAQDYDGPQVAEPVPPSQRQNLPLGPIGGGGSCAPGESKLISEIADSASNRVRLRCDGAFLLYYLRHGQSSGCHIGQCSYTWGENVGWVEYAQNGQFARTVWRNYEGHTSHNPAGPVYDGNHNGGEDRDTYIYDPATRTYTIIREVRMLNNGLSDPGQPWIEEGRDVYAAYCAPSPPANGDEAPQFVSNAAHVTSLQFFGHVEGNGQVIVTVNGVQTVVPTQQGSTPAQLAQQLAQQFNQQWREGPAQQQQQGKSATQDQVYPQIVRLHNVDEDEVLIQRVGEPGLGQNFYPYPVQGVQGTQAAQENVGLGGEGSTCPPNNPAIDTKIDNAGNRVVLDCTGSAFHLNFIPAGGDSCRVGVCRYAWGENVGRVQYYPNGTLAKTVWINYEGHYNHDPSLPVADDPPGLPGHGLENREVYTYDVQSRTYAIHHQVRPLLPSGHSDWSGSWQSWTPANSNPVYYPTEIRSNHCDAAPPPDDEPQIQFISNAARVTPLQFIGTAGSGQVIVSINNVQVVVETQEGAGSQQVAGQVAQQFNETWQQGGQQDQGKSATQVGPAVYIRNADEDEINVLLLGQPELRFRFGPPEGACGFHILGDFNTDCVVNLLDFARFAENWLTDCNGNPADPGCQSHP